MNIAELKAALKLCRRVKLTARLRNKRTFTVMIWGHRGLGKSSGAEQFATEEDLCPTGRGPSGIYDYRCSQIEASDMRGLPDKRDGLTAYLPPEDLPQGEFYCRACKKTFGEHGSYAVNQKLPSSCQLCKATEAGSGEDKKPAVRLHECLLLFDELNRSADDVLQASFQAIYDDRIGSYMFPTGVFPVAAGNPSEGYMVNSFNDPAFLDRFCHLSVAASESYYAGWAEHMHAQKYRAQDKVLQFVGFNNDHLMGKVKGDLGFSVQPSPRKWEMVMQVLEVADDETDQGVLNEVVCGLIGRELGIQFSRFSVDVTPKDVIGVGVEKLKGKLDKFDHNQMAGLVWGVISHAREKVGNDNVLDFMEYVAKRPSERDLAVALGKALVDPEVRGMAGATISNPAVAKLLAQFSSKKKKSWVQAINDRPELQKLMSRVAFGI
jgi:hypothetical protein